jgi:hypothetical protein
MWIYIPKSDQFPCVPESPDSISASDWRFQLLESSAMLRSKPSPARSWYRAWKKESWMQRLFGAISKPSTANLGVEKFISSLADSPASHFLNQERSAEIKTQDISGPTSVELSLRFSRNTVSSRTSPAYSQPSLPMDDTPSKSSATIYKEWATKLKRDYLARKKSAHRTREKESTSWPTPDVGSGKRTMNPEELSRRGRMDDGIKRTVGRPTVVAYWQTPAAASFSKRRQVGQTERTEELLPSQAVTVSNNIRSCPTPNARDWKGKSGYADQKSLTKDVENWGTPTARDWKDGDVSDVNVPTNGLLADQVTRWQPSRQVRIRSKNGQESLVSTPTSRPRLNVLFAEWLMGLPMGWTNPHLPITLTDFERWEMGLCHLLRDSLSLYYTNA